MLTKYISKDMKNLSIHISVCVSIYLFDDIVVRVAVRPRTDSVTPPAHRGARWGAVHSLVEHKVQLWTAGRWMRKALCGESSKTPRRPSMSWVLSRCGDSKGSSSSQGVAGNSDPPIRLNSKCPTWIRLKCWRSRWSLFIRGQPDDAHSVQCGIWQNDNSQRSTVARTGPRKRSGAPERGVGDQSTALVFYLLQLRGKPDKHSLVPFLWGQSTPHYHHPPPTTAWPHQL